MVFICETLYFDQFLKYFIHILQEKYFIFLCKKQGQNKNYFTTKENQSLIVIKKNVCGYIDFFFNF